MKKAVSFLYFFLLSCLLFSVTALAYIDPSAMTYMIQLVAGIAIAAGAGGSYYFRRFRQKLSRRGQGRAAAQPYGGDDDDDTGYGDYELDSPAPAAEAAQASAFQAQPAPAGQAPAAPACDGAVPAAEDPFDETGGAAGLIAENRELRRLLALERQNVEELKRALHICTSPRR